MGCGTQNERGYREWGVLESVPNTLGLGIKAKKCQNKGVIAPTALCGAEVWGRRSDVRRKVNVLKIKCLRSWLDVTNE